MAKRKARLLKENVFLFALSKKHKIQEYKSNISAFGYPLEQVPKRYRTLELCKLYIKKCPERFDLNLIPKEYINYDFYKYCIDCGVSPSKIYESPSFNISEDEFQELCKYAARQVAGIYLWQIPDKFKTYEICKLFIENDYYSINWVPKEILNEELCNLAIKNGLFLSDVPEEFVDKCVTREMCEDKVRKNFRNIYLLPKKFVDVDMCTLAMKQMKQHIRKTGKIEDVPKSIYDIKVEINEELYEAWVEFDANNLEKVPYDPSHDICKRTKKMCEEYIRQNKKVRLDLFPARFLNPEFIKTLYIDMMKFIGTLDGLLDYSEYFRFSSLHGANQVKEYLDMFSNLINRMLDENDDLRDTRISENKLNEIKSTKTFTILQNVINTFDMDAIFGGENKKVDEKENNEELLTNVYTVLGEKVEEKNTRTYYVTSDSNEDEIHNSAWQIAQLMGNAVIVENPERTLTDAERIHILEPVCDLIKDMMSGLNIKKRGAFADKLKKELQKIGNEDNNEDYYKKFEKLIEYGYGSTVSKFVDGLLGVESYNVSSFFELMEQLRTRYHK